MNSAFPALEKSSANDYIDEDMTIENLIKYLGFEDEEDLRNYLKHYSLD
ncbi:MAG: hypothetical protein ACPKPY_00625 [Nitrososphaeraceae archaeon]